MNNNSVIVTDIRWCDFEVVDGGDNIEFELSVAARLENSGIDLDLLYTGSVKLLQRGDDSGLLSST